MKTLRRIFLKGFPKNYFVIVLVTLTCLLTYRFTLVGAEDSSFLDIINKFSLIGALCGPVITFFVNTQFAYNVKFLINQHFTRAELIKFFAFSQLLKIGLVCLNYIFLALLTFFIFEASSKGNNVSTDKVLNASSWLKPSTFYTGYVALSACFFVFFISGLFGGANKDEILIARITSGLNDDDREKHFSDILKFLGVYGVAVFIIIKLASSQAILFLFISLVLFFLSIVTVDSVFKIFEKDESTKYPLLGSLLACVPLFVLLGGMMLEAKDSDLSFKDRANAVSYLGWLTPDFNDREKLKLLEKAGPKEYKSILQLFETDVPFKDSLELVNNAKRAKIFIDNYSKKLDEGHVVLMVNHMADLFNSNDKRYALALYSHSFFVKQKVRVEYIEELSNSKSIYKQLASIYFAKNSMNKKDFVKFVENKKDFFEEKLMKNKFVERSIAGAKE